MDLSSERFPFPKYQKKNFGGKKVNLAKKFFNLAKKVGPYSIYGPHSFAW
jgi:hypothetical protein